MSVGFVLAISIVMQLATVLLAFRLIRITGWRSSWLLVSVGILFMAVRRGISFIRLETGMPGPHPDMMFELFGLLTSAFMLCGVALLTPDFRSFMKTANNLRHRYRIERIISRISSDFISRQSENVFEGITLALRQVGEFLGVDRAYMFLYSGDGKAMSNTNEWCAEGIEPFISSLQDIGADTMPWFARKILNEESIHVGRVRDLPFEASVEKEHFAAQDIKSLIVVPMTLKGAVIGFVGFDSVRSEKMWIEEDVDALKILAEIFLTALERKKTEDERTGLIADLKSALSEISTLRGILPICASCKKIRDDAGYWNQIESYITAHSDATFSHGICPECAVKLYPELYGEKKTG
ncbi:MAG: GAF domain-containing protein [Nitrospirae bacterium]|nr:GAF domain-containing protein [Nitrospirota bacterium]